MHDVAVGHHLVGGDDGLQVRVPGQIGCDGAQHPGVVGGLAVQVENTLFGQGQRQGGARLLGSARCLGQLDLDRRVHDIGGGDHEDDEQDKRDIHQRRDIDVGDHPA